MALIDLDLLVFPMSLSLQHRRYMMGVVMLLMFMPPGMWVSSLPNIQSIKYGFREAERGNKNRL